MSEIIRTSAGRAPTIYRESETSQRYRRQQDNPAHGQAVKVRVIVTQVTERPQKLLLPGQIRRTDMDLSTGAGAGYRDRSRLLCYTRYATIHGTVQCTGPPGRVPRSCNMLLDARFSRNVRTNFKVNFFLGGNFD